MAARHFSVRKHGQALYPADSLAERVIGNLGNGDEVMITLRKARNIKHHRKLFALLQIVWESTRIQDLYPSVENLLDALKLALGYTEPIQLPDGKIAMKVKSIAFESMDQTAFDDFYDKVVDIIVTQLVPHLDRADLERQVQELLKERRR